MAYLTSIGNKTIYLSIALSQMDAPGWFFEATFTDLPPEIQRPKCDTEPYGQPEAWSEIKFRTHPQRRRKVEQCNKVISEAQPDTRLRQHFPQWWG